MPALLWTLLVAGLGAGFVIWIGNITLDGALWLLFIIFVTYYWVYFDLRKQQSPRFLAWMGSGWTFAGGMLFWQTAIELIEAYSQSPPDTSFMMFANASFTLYALSNGAYRLSQFMRQKLSDSKTGQSR